MDRYRDEIRRALHERGNGWEAPASASASAPSDAERSGRNDAILQLRDRFLEQMAEHGLPGTVALPVAARCSSRRQWLAARRRASRAIPGFHRARLTLALRRRIGTVDGWTVSQTYGIVVTREGELLFGGVPLWWPSTWERSQPARWATTLTVDDVAEGLYGQLVRHGVESTD
ncbi:MAG: hypothetical protein ACRD0G_01130 [Acidimicrobiales bacterium]